MIIPARDTYRILTRLTDFGHLVPRLTARELEQLDAALDEIDMLRDEVARLKTWLGDRL